jgi:hypothetical protein
VLGAQGALSESTNVVYDERRIDERSQVIGVAIDARAQFYPEETRYHYLPMAGREQELAFHSANWEKIVKDYNLKDLSI